MPAAHALLTFAAATMVLLLIPGPAVLFILNHSITGGRNAALAAVAGLEIGDALQAVAAAAGLSAIIATSATAFSAVKWVGVAYLVVTGLRTLSRPASRLTAGAGAGPRRAHLVRQGILVNALNPKTSMFFLSIFPQFIDPNAGHTMAQSLVLGAVFVVMATVTNGAYAIIASHLGSRLVSSRSLPFVRRWVSGGTFLGLGVLAATASRSSA